jgi:hypothetical protein
LKFEVVFLLVVFPVVVSSSSESGAIKFGGGVGVTEDLLLFARFRVVVCPPRTPMSVILCVFVNGASKPLWGKKVKQMECACTIFIARKHAQKDHHVSRPRVIKKKKCL